MKPTLEQLIRYGIVGIASNAVGYMIYLAITAAGMEHKVAMTLVYVVGVAQTFVFNKRWSFRYANEQWTVLVRYSIAYALGFLFNFWALWLLVDVLGQSHQIVQAAMVLLVAMLLFVLQKLWVFR